MSIKISVIMPSFLGDYDYAATERGEKFNRAVQSFLNQNYTNKELIIVSDGCYETIERAAHFIADNPHTDIKLIKLDKQELFSGNVRNTGLFHSQGDVICYLDSDDMLGSNHLSTIAYYFEINPSLDWLYYDDYVVHRFHPIDKEILVEGKRENTLEHGTIGTSSIAHKNLKSISWDGCDGYGHDWTFIKKNLIDTELKHTKIHGASYYVCHIPNGLDV